MSLTQKWQMAVIFGGMVTAFVALLLKLPEDSAQIAGAMGKLQAVDFDLDLDKRYTIWSGIFGGLFLQLSYFGTDQSQVQRYIGGAGLREGRLGLMFNAVLKIPMQFFIVLLGALLFVFYQFQPNTPVFFNQTEWRRHATGEHAETFRAIEQKHVVLHADKQEKIRAWVAVKDGGDAAKEAAARTALTDAQKATEAVRKEARDTLLKVDPRAKVKDSDYVFITFILTQLPHGAIGLLIAVMFASALSSKAGELNALGTASTIDLWRQFRPLATHDERRNVRNAKWFTAFWGLFAIGFALFASFAENLIEALNIIASIFYPIVLGLFVVAFFFKKIGGTAVFCGAIAALAAIAGMYVFGQMYPKQAIGYLWFNPIGCVVCVVVSYLLQTLFDARNNGRGDTPLAA